VVNCLLTDSLVGDYVAILFDAFLPTFLLLYKQEAPCHFLPTLCPVFRIRIRFSRIRILDLFPDPDTDSGSGSRSSQQKTNFSRAKTKFLKKFLFSTQKVGILSLFLTDQVPRYFNFIKQRTFIWYRYHFQK